MIRKKKTILALILLAITLPSLAQNDISWEVEMQTTNGGGKFSPLWLNANRYGLSSLEKNNGYLLAGIEKPLALDSAKQWGLGYGVSMAVAYDFTSSIVVQEAYVEGRWKKGVFSVGSKEWPMEFKNNELSSGSQTFGINARPVPQVRLALPEYWSFGKGWFALKGYIAYGMQTDDKWQKEFTHQESRYTEHVLYHAKAAYLRIGRPGVKRVTAELGLEHASLFGGTSYRKWENGQLVGVKNRIGLSSFWHAFYGGGNDVGEGTYKNVEGDMLGSWVVRINYDAPSWNLGVYADHFFEDHSSMFFLDYDGYGEGDEWQEKKRHRFLLYDLKDIMLGVELQLKKCSWLKTIVAEYLYTKYQSGPIYHDHTETIPDHIGGADEYYNHGIFCGWQHWGMVMGNPLYRSPLYNDDGTIYVKNNRFIAWHFGVNGSITPYLDYRLLATWQKGWGASKKGWDTKNYMFPHPRRNGSLMAEATYKIASKGLQFTAAMGLDKGTLLGDNFGIQLTATKKGIFKIKRSRK